MQGRRAARRWRDRAPGAVARAAIGVVALLLSTSPARGADWSWGEVSARLDSFASVSASIATEDPDCKRIGADNPGACSRPDLETQGTVINSDDGALNWEEGDVFSVLFQATHELDLRWRDYGAFLRATYFADAIQADKSSGQRTSLDDDARFRGSVLEGGVVGAQFLLLDAYAYASFEAADRFFDIRAGNQVVNWGESTFTQGGINATNTLDVARLRLAGAELREGLQPAPILLVSGDLFAGIGFDAYYQAAWRQTEVDPVGTFFSTNDLVGRGAEGFFTPALAPGQPGDPGSSGLSAREIFDLGFVTGGAPRTSDSDARDQGQWGAALRYYVDALETEFAAYYLRLHAKNPSVGFRGACPEGVTGAACLFEPRVIHYYREFPEDIDLVGVSFNTVLGGVSFAGEVSFRPNEPVPITSALPDLTSAILAGAEGGREKGYRREERILGILNAVYVVGPGAPVLGAALPFLGASDLTLVGEVAVESFPDLSNDAAYALPLNESDLDDEAVSYTLRMDLHYDRVFGTAVGATPSVTFRHDVYGTHPGNGSLFTEDVQAVAVQLEMNYQERWELVLAYQNQFGAGRSNPNNDRDFASIRLSRAF